MDSLDADIERQGDIVRALKAAKAAKPDIASAVASLKALKVKKESLLAASQSPVFSQAALDSLLQRRFFYVPSFHIYGGISGLYDYGPPGCGLQANILALWRQHFVLEEDMLELECTNLTPKTVLKTSGHVDRFADYMVKDTVSGDIFRADHLVKQVLQLRLSQDAALRAGQKIKNAVKIEDPAVKAHYEEILETLDNYQGDDLGKLIKTLDIRAPETGNPVSEPTLFNLMFATQIGPTGQFEAFLRPETAQGHFLNFKKLLEFNTEQMPFASASIGKSFRNEISPRQGLLRVREFTMAEIEHFVDPECKDHARFDEIKDTVLPLYSKEAQMAASGPVELSMGDAVAKGIVDNQTLGYFLVRIYSFLLRIGIDKKRIRFRQHFDKEMAHYACDCWDAEIESSYGWIECVGCADRSAYDLTVHAKKTGEKLVVRKPLAQPIIRQGLVLELNRKLIGPAFKKDAKAVQGYFEALADGDDWDQQKLADLQQALKDGNGSAAITGTDGKSYTISADMVKIEEKTVRKNVREYTPNVIEPSFGIGRILYSLLEHSYYTREGDEKRGVLSFPPVIAPTKALIVPISHNEKFLPFIKQLSGGLRKRGIMNKTDDSAVSIGKRYSRNDELGTPFAITIDFQTVQDSSVTLRERDSTKQIRESVCACETNLIPQIPVILDVIKDLCEEKTTWDQVMCKFPAFVEQQI